MLEEDRTAICGPRYAHEPDRAASRAGTMRSEVVARGPQGPHSPTTGAHGQLETDHPSAAESLREGFDETLTIVGPGLSPTLRRSLSTTNAAESLISRTRSVKRNVKRWRNGQMVVRWVAASVLEAVKE